MEQQTTLGIERVLGILRRRAPWIVLCFVLVAAVAYGYSKHETKKYTATSSLSFSNDSLSGQIAGLTTGGASSLVAQQDNDIELVRLGKMAERTAGVLGQGLTTEEVTKSVSVAAKGESGVVDVSATSTSPRLAAEIANTYAIEAAKEQRSTNRAFFKNALALVNKQLAHLSPLQRFGSDGLNLENRAQTLGLLSELGYNNVEVAQEALIPSSPSSPRTKRNTLLGAILGLLLGLGVAASLERFDRRIREPDELGALYTAPMLGLVPTSRALRAKGAALPAAEAEVFSLIRAHMRFFNVGREVRTIVIASPAPGDGKTTVARRLAEAAARLGSRVLLLEADLRHPSLAQQLELPPGSGLADVLVEAVSAADATHSVPVSGRGRSHTLDVMAAGATPPNPGELLDSRGMGAVLEQARAMYDFVVVDTPPLNVVSDAFPLLTKVDGVVVVGWVGRSRSDDAERLQQVLAGSGAPLLGVIANGSKSDGPNPYVESGKDEAPPADASSNGASASEALAPTVNS
jgi:polysaccharide biosynthesis transport protein